MSGSQTPEALIPQRERRQLRAFGPIRRRDHDVLLALPQVRHGRARCDAVQLQFVQYLAGLLIDRPERRTTAILRVLSVSGSSAVSTGQSIQDYQDSQFSAQSPRNGVFRIYCVGHLHLNLHSA